MANNLKQNYNGSMLFTLSVSGWLVILAGSQRSAGWWQTEGGPQWTSAIHEMCLSICIQHLILGLNGESEGLSNNAPRVICLLLSGLMFISLLTLSSQLIHLGTLSRPIRGQRCSSIDQSEPGMMTLSKCPSYSHLISVCSHFLTHVIAIVSSVNMFNAEQTVFSKMSDCLPRAENN